MKKVFTLMTLLAASACGAMAQNKAMSVLRNDGVEPEFFYKSDVDSIVYSKVDLDGNAHDEYVVQEIWVNKVASRIPLDAIESVTFTDDTEGHYYRRCPDDNHPHAIDLGLPSGTKWCCCNVGATSPEAYGGYYAWGETEEKSSYGLDNYAYTHYDKKSGHIDGYIDIGTEISGTQYDVAHVRMGGAWCMPTNEQQTELIDHSTSKKMRFKEVSGLLITGQNGGCVFFPSAGVRLAVIPRKYAGSNYWSGSTINGDDASAYGFEVDMLYLRSSAYDRFMGYPVRAVCP